MTGAASLASDIQHTTPFHAIRTRGHNRLDQDDISHSSTQGEYTMRLDPDNRASGSSGLTTAAPALWLHARKHASPAESGRHRITALRQLRGLVRTGTTVLGLALASLLLLTPDVQAKGGVGAVNRPGVGPATPAGSPTPFDIVGAIQSFSAFTPNNAYSGGTIVVNGTSVKIPANLVVTLPAAYFTVGQLFGNSLQSGLALNDTPPPIAAYEVSISGNIVNGEYLAGLVSIAQQSANIGNGFIKSINYTTGELCVGSTNVGGCTSADARVVINDPEGRYGQKNGVNGKATPDPRFSVDSDNPTIHAASGYPLCVPRVAPPAIDAECPMVNRPKDATGAFSPLYVMDANALIPPVLFAVGGVGAVPPCPACNPAKQAPLVVGDYINYSGILASNGTGGTYMAAYALEANVGIYTQIGKTPFYMFMDAPLISTGPGICPANAECQARLKTSIWVTDPSRTPAMYAVDENPDTGARTSRPLPSTLTNTAFFGRFVFVTDKELLVLGNQTTEGVTREIMARVAGVPAGTPVFYATTGAPNSSVAANGLVFGQYVSPVGNYIFPERNAAGAILTPYNFRCLAFLAKGWAQGGALPRIGPLAPFPEAGGLAPAGVNCAF